MQFSDAWKIISVFLSCAFFFGKIGMPAAVSLFKFHFLKSILVSCSGGIFGAISSTYLSAGIIDWWENFKKKWFKNHQPKKKFSKTNRFIIKVKHRFGIVGIALLSPVLLSIPLGAFIAERFYKDKKKVILYLSGSVIFWSFTLYFLFYFFYSSFKHFIS